LDGEQPILSFPPLLLLLICALVRLPLRATFVDLNVEFHEIELSGVAQQRKLGVYEDSEKGG
jgi:hypothetical protein